MLASSAASQKVPPASGQSQSQSPRQTSKVQAELPQSSQPSQTAGRASLDRDGLALHPPPNGTVVGGGGGGSNGGGGGKGGVGGGGVGGGPGGACGGGGGGAGGAGGGGAAGGGASGTARNVSASAVSFVPRGGSGLNPCAGPGSFSAELRSQMMPIRVGSRIDVGSMHTNNSLMEKVDEDESNSVVEQTLSALRDRLKREMKIKEGSENMLEALNLKKAKQTKEQRLRVEAELSASNTRIKELRQKITDTQQQQQHQQQQQTRLPPPSTPTRSRTLSQSQSQDAAASASAFPSRSPHSARSPGGGTAGKAGGGGGGSGEGQFGGGGGGGSDVEEATESPTFALAELLQALEVEGMAPEYYVSRANQVVDLFKRYPTLKYDLAWSVFGLRMQTMLLSESREVVAAGYRVTRYAISDRLSLQKIRGLNIDFLVIRSLNNYRKADVEREQALKFVRAFLDVKDGVKEISRAVVRTIVAVAEYGEERPAGASQSSGSDQNVDRLRPICIETLAEIMVRDPRLLVASGGLGSLSEALAGGAYKAPESLTSAFLFLLDTPQRRKYVRPGYGLEVLMHPFTDQLAGNEATLKQNCKAIAIAMKSWSGLTTLCMYDFRSIRSLLMSMILPNATVKDIVLDLVFSLLRIKPPAWAVSFLAGRRLTTYGRVTNLKAETKDRGYLEEETGEQNFVDHYTALILAVFIKSGLVQCLLQVARSENDSMMKRKATLLIGEVLKLAAKLLPPSWSAGLQLLPELFSDAAKFGHDDDRNMASGVVYQISSVSRTLYRSAPAESPGILPSSDSMNDLALLDDQRKGSSAMVFDDATFRQLLIDTGVLNSSNYTKWNWENIIKVIDGPLQVGKRLEEAIKASKFMKRIMSFYRPFKYKFSSIRNTRSTQKYVRAGCALMHSLLQSAEGVKFLADSKLLRQIAECLAQCDPTSGLTAQYPMFSKDRLVDTLCAGYFSMLGVLSGDLKGLNMIERWRMFNMMYHIAELQQRPDLVRLLLSNFDYNLQGHPRVFLSKALTAGTKDIRIHATNTLRKCTLRRLPSINDQGEVSDSKWAIQLLVTQLYDPEIEVCSTAVKILEKACNRKAYLAYIVECRPALDHLGEIGAPLLLRFLSTSIGYHYLDGLDYISSEMDDWFLGRNDSYVGVIEASLAKAFLSEQDDQNHRMSVFEETEVEAEFSDSHIPPHFYRELTRTQEGCKLLSDKGHFEEFANTIREHGMQVEDAELITKVKGCLWAVGNVGSMELGAPFLESTDMVEQIIKIAKSHEVMSLRGTAFFVLGLISRSTHGLEILYENGWDANTTIMGSSLGLCVPTDLSTLFSMTPWKCETAASIRLPESQRTIQQPPAPTAARPPLEQTDMPSLLNDEAMNERIMGLLVDLGNTVLYKKAVTEMSKIKARKPVAFRSAEFFKQVIGLMEWNHYRLGVRRMAIDLFDKDVMRQIVFGEEEEEEEDGGEDYEGGRRQRNEGQEEDEKEENEEEEEDKGRQEERRAQMGRTQARRGQVFGSEGAGARDREADGEGSSEEDTKTERQRSISEPADLPSSMIPSPLRYRI